MELKLNTSILKEVNKETLLSLKFVVDQLEQDDYASPVAELSQTPLSKHIRHILDFYRNMLNHGTIGGINYDMRFRGSDIETNKKSAIDCIDHIIDAIADLDIDKNVTLSQDFAGEPLHIESTLGRELLYNLEHAIHHMALIRVGLNLRFKYVLYNEQFGVAYSTLAAAQT